MNGILHDVRYAFRQMRKHPAFTAAVLMTLALGIGANTALFTLIHAVMLKALPVAKPEELYRLGDAPVCCVQTGLQNNWGLFSDSLYRQFKDHTLAFQELAAFQGGETDLNVRREGRSAAEHALGEFVSGNYFSTFGVHVLAGRNIGPTDDETRALPVTVMSFRYWQAHYGSNPSIIRSAVTLNGTPFAVIGIAPSGFYGDTLRENPPDFWMPLMTEPLVRRQNSLLHQSDVNWLYLMGRLKPGARPSQVSAQATLELQQWLSNRGRVSPDGGKKISEQVVHLTPGAHGIVARLQSQYSSGLLLLMGISGLVLLICCANIANLFLARGRVASQQSAVCLALGASRSRLIRQTLVETVLIALFGGATAVAVAYGAAHMLLALAFHGAALVPISPDPSLPVLSFAFVVSLFTGVCFGIVPAWVASCSDPMEALRGTRGLTGLRPELSQRSLLVLQVSLSIVLLVPSGLLVQSLRNLENERFGFATNDRWVINVDTESAGLNLHHLQSLYPQIRQRLSEIPGITSASISRYAPMSGWQWDDDVYIERQSVGLATPNRDASWNRVSPEYFQTIGTPLLRGRTITEQDTPTSPRVAVVNQTFVERFIRGGVDPLGKHFGIGAASNANSYEIVGVVADAKYWNTDHAVPMFFVPFLQLTPYTDARFEKTDIRSNYARNIELDVQGNSLGLGKAIRGALREVDPDLPVLGIRTFDEQIRRYFNHQELVARLSGVLGMLALMVATLGVYAVTSHSVARRTNEIGIRMALGSNRRRVVFMVLGSTFAQISLGLALGIPVALLVCRLLGNQLYGVSNSDPLSYAIACALLAIFSLIAASVPARRAAKVDPMEALRYE